tara:strand:- start:401 stop:787 length:387 start_codon:yes stop_codon:yes gene_type:complete
LPFLQNLPNTCSTAVLNGLSIAIIEMSHPIIYRERIAIGPLRKCKVTEWIWIGWCLCEVSEAQAQEKTSDEPYSRCTVCRKFVKELRQCSFISNKCQDAIHPFSNLEEALASLKRDLGHTKSLSSTET